MAKAFKAAGSILTAFQRQMVISSTPTLSAAATSSRRKRKTILPVHELLRRLARHPFRAVVRGDRHKTPERTQPAGSPAADTAGRPLARDACGRARGEVSRGSRALPRRNPGCIIDVRWQVGSTICEAVDGQFDVPSTIRCDVVSVNSSRISLLHVSNARARYPAYICNM